MELELLSGGSSAAQTFVGILLVVLGWLARNAITENTTTQKATNAELAKLSTALEDHKKATQAETRAIQAELVIHERRLDGHDEAFRRMGRNPGGTGSAGSGE